MRRTSLVILGVVLVLFIVGCGTTTTTTTAPPTTAAPAAGAAFTADLSGKNPVPPNSSTATGQATFTLSSDATSMTFELTVDNLTDVTAAHIHMGAAGAEGPIVVPLFTGPAKTGAFTGVLAQGTLTAADFAGDLQGKTMADLLALIEASNAYVNVHTKAFPGGEIRGQITAPSSSASTQTTAASGAGTAGGGTATTNAAGY